MESLSLYKLNEQLKITLKQAFAFAVWVHAEISEFHENANGHCYLELIEKDTVTDAIIARQRGMIWGQTYKMLKPYFQSVTGTSLCVGMKVLISCQVEMHEVYGISLTIRDIDPSYTVGESAVRRAQIIHNLTEEGVVEMNRQLEMPQLPQRVAVISSSSAAGYGDFLHQLSHNSFGYHFYVKLFTATMQGGKTEQSVIAALDKISMHIDAFDVVVIIRGGGATSDLAAFDSYMLALHCAQFPLPIISGIGHLRDDTIIDLVAHTCVKTPTAAAEFLVNRLHQADLFLNALCDSMIYAAREQLREEKHRNQLILGRMPHRAEDWLYSYYQQLEKITLNLKHQVTQNSARQWYKVSLIDKSVALMQAAESNPLRIERDGQLVTSIRQLHEDDIIDILLPDGRAQGRITRKEENA